MGLRNVQSLIQLIIVVFNVHSLEVQNEREAVVLGKCNRAEHGDWMYWNDPKLPPCWVRKGDKYECYDYKSKEQCDIISGMFDINKILEEQRKKKERISKNQIQKSKNPSLTSCKLNAYNVSCKISEEKCPPCWVKTINNGYYCFEYKLGMNSCDKIPGMIDITKSYNIEAFDPSPPIKQYDPKIKHPLEVCQFLGAQKLCSVLLGECPPCWIKNESCFFDCFEFKSGTKECDSIPGMVDIFKPYKLPDFLNVE